MLSDYVIECIRLLLEHPEIIGEEQEFITLFLESFLIEEYEESDLRRILARASFLDCLPMIEEAEQDSDAFFNQVAKKQRDEFKRHELIAGSGFNQYTCPCYICNVLCLQRLHGSPERTQSDIDRGFFSWHRGHVIPNMVGKENKNTYNYRIICSQCNLASSTMYPADYAAYALPTNKRSLATVEDITSVLDALRIYFSD